MVTSGLRTVEVARANIEDMRTVADFTALYIQGKGHEERTAYVKLAEPVEAAIRDYLAARGKAEATSPLFSSDAHRNAGERMTTRSISRIVKEALIAAGLDSDRLTAHSLRHTTATLNLLNGGTVEETQQLLRHTNINTTLIYSHALERAKNNSEARVAKAIFG
jgi:integrase/recombinase XerC